MGTPVGEKREVASRPKTVVYLTLLEEWCVWGKGCLKVPGSADLGFYAAAVDFARNG